MYKWPVAKITPAGNWAAKRVITVPGGTGSESSNRSNSAALAIPTGRGKGRDSRGRGLNPSENLTGNWARASARSNMRIISWCERKRRSPSIAKRTATLFRNSSEILYSNYVDNFCFMPFRDTRIGSDYRPAVQSNGR